MSFKKLLGIISAVIIVMFSMMLTTSYAWYAFDNASTVFEGVTNNDDIIVSYQSGEYINTSVAIPISSSEIIQYSEKNNFSIDVKNDVEDDMELAVTISLVDISIDRALQTTNFKVDLYYMGSRVITMGGNSFSSTTKELATVTLDNDITNEFQLRVYLLDDGTNQTSLMNKSFSAKIKVDVVSRLKTSFVDWTGADIYVSSITVDGETSKNIPTSGYYDMTANCTKGSQLEWDPLTKTITYTAGSKTNDNCSLAFTSSIDYPLLSEMPVGSYVKYRGNNGCSGKACEGQNANYVNDTDMGYCGTSDHKFYVNGWIIGYIENGSAYLISAGAPECMCTDSDGTSSSSGCDGELAASDRYKHYDNLDAVSLKYCNSSFSKNGVCDSSTVWAMDAIDFEKITGVVLFSNPNLCYRKYSTMLCGYNNDLIDNGGYYWFASARSSSTTAGTGWSPVKRGVFTEEFVVSNGVRPVLYLESSVVVIDGTGTYENPYVISNS